LERDARQQKVAIDDSGLQVRSFVERRNMYSEAAVQRQVDGPASASLDSESIKHLDGVIGHSAPIRALTNTVLKFARHDFAVLIRGESGTGKELIARSIQRNSKRAKGPFVTVNSGALPDSLTEALLFGYEKGSFTGASLDKRGLFEAANGGTLFLDEIGEMPLSTQVKLLRALQEREIVRLGAARPIAIDVRVVAATNRDLKRMMAEGQFREDLYYRISALEIQVPPLRDRREDIPALVHHILEKVSKMSEFERPVTIAEDAVNLLASCDWPGNVRELENTINRLIVIAKEPTITRADVQQVLGTNGLGTVDPVCASDSTATTETRLLLPSTTSELCEHETFKTYIRRVKLDVFAAAITQYPTKTAAAERLGLTKGALKRQLQYLRQTPTRCTTTTTKEQEEV
jgi:transcriptional regulator with PAS, ATPase and Fis domain